MGLCCIPAYALVSAFEACFQDGFCFLCLNVDIVISSPIGQLNKAFKHFRGVIWKHFAQRLHLNSD